MRLSDVPPEQLVELDLDGETLLGRRGESVASALLAADQWLLGRSVKYHRPRAAFCLAGSCGSCLVRIDGRPNIRACRTALTRRSRHDFSSCAATCRCDRLALAFLDARPV